MQAGGSKGFNSSINVTPLVDVVLVLLIIFMVITPMLQKGVEVKLPSAKNPNETKKVTDEIVVAIKADKTLWVDTALVSEPELRTKLVTVLQKNAGANVFLKGDKSLSYGDVKHVMMLCHESGAQSVALATQDPEKGN